MTGRARIAVVGAGWWSSIAHLPSLARDPRVDLVAICDPDPARARAATATFGGTAFSDLDTLLEDVPLDGLVVATPHTTHFGLVRAGLRAGVPVLVEKPMTTSPAEAWELVELARSSGLLLALGLTYQYTPTAEAVRDTVRDRIGDLVSINAEFSSNTQRLFETVSAEDAHLDDPASPHGTTYSDPATGGGQGHTQLTHLLGGALWAAGEQAVGVNAFMSERGLAVDLVDALAFRLESGALGAASSTGTTPPGVPVRHRLRFHGTGGMVEWDMLKADALIHLAGGRIEHLENPEDRPSYPRERVATAFVSSILDGDPTPAPADFAAASVSLIAAAYEAARTGTTVDVQQGTLAR